MHQCIPLPLWSGPNLRGVGEWRRNVEGLKEIKSNLSSGAGPLIRPKGSAKTLPSLVNYSKRQRRLKCEFILEAIRTDSQFP